MRTTKKQGQPQRPQARSLKIQPKHRFNRLSTTVVPELKLCGNWMEQLGFKVDERVTIHASKELIVIQPQQQEE